MFVSNLNFDFETIMKMKTVMDSARTEKFKGVIFKSTSVLVRIVHSKFYRRCKCIK